ncbi:DNA-binding SARP family transcriptional activator/predicted ATPase/tetratricopeptide (TPR) repeat protein [Saccharomonospora amisosensis]|uniref:DNA-binding SARP family transcriptional activator/predicted ATPase/tetratricopeptide (TPR) repeat protein n=1 Tax=Saccharomonospora amisosensis TaxID=1128677 RepID=A0A7X5UUR4_9PSEU|nr:AfsR/SARP family transcriptional regulator [Saccharomonospora amisosensis]NIJ14553.1 DNA-binding SARP family transcriptional activator/predicted ATPase/tetratricopeptide (TPR) repeat protein [Saccharomonospora amisosensis]
MDKATRRVLVSVLGPPCVRRRDHDEPIADPALRVVLATLLVNANQPVSESELIAAAWAGTEKPANPHDSLYTRISRLRTLLAPDGDVTWSPAGYVLRIDPQRIDAVYFEWLIETARWSDPAGAVELLTGALTMWRGEPLPQLRDAGLDHPEAVRLKQLRLRAVEDLAIRELQLGDPVRAAQRLLALLEVQPHRERACGYAMWALHGIGRTADAARQYELLRDRLATELGAEPGSELRCTYHAVTGSPPPRLRGTAAPPASGFVGRQPELARLTAMLRRDGIVTVVGRPGAGKTRLALEAVSVVADPVAVVPLTDQDGDTVALAVAAALGVQTDGDGESAAAAVTEYLIGRRQVLVLDGCEHVLYAVRGLLRRIQWRCHAVTVLATSRVRLGLGGEQVLALGPLPVDPATDPLASPAGQLFLERAGEAGTGFPATQAEAELARAVLRGLDCLPLSVELLAARLASREGQPPAQWPPDIAEWCYEDSGNAERDLLAALAVFHRDFDLASCRAVVTDGGDVESLLRRLTGARLLTTDGTAAQARYRLPDQLRRIAATRLSGSDHEPKVRERHARWCRETVVAATRRAAEDFPSAAWSVHKAATDIAGALRWAEVEDPPLAADVTGHLGLLSPYRCEPGLLAWRLRVARTDTEHALAVASGAGAAVHLGHVEEALRLATKAAESATTTEERYLALHSLASARLLWGDPVGAAASCAELTAVPDLTERCRVDALALSALAAARKGSHDEARRTAADAVGLAEASGAADRLAFARYVEGEVRVRTDTAAGAAILRTARAQAVAAGAAVVNRWATTTLAAALVRLGRVPEAAKLLQEALWHCRRARVLPDTVAAVGVAADLLTAAGDRQAAQRLRSEPPPGDHLAAAEVADGAARAIAVWFGTWQP